MDYVQRFVSEIDFFHYAEAVQLETGHAFGPADAMTGGDKLLLQSPHDRE